MCRDRRDRRRRIVPVLLAAAALAPSAAVAARDDIGALQARIAAMPVAEREALQQRALAWDAATPAARAARREGWAAWQALPDADRASLRIAAQRFAALDPAGQASMRARWAALDDYERSGWALGPAIGAAWPRLHALLAQVAPAEREPLLRALHALPPQALADLAVLAQRTPPQARAALRRDLLATDASVRAEWLRRRVDPLP